MPLARRIAAALCLLAGTASPSSATELFDACAAAGASKWEPGYEGIGPVDIGTFYAYEAIDACKLALAEDPSNIQIMAWLGNAYVADNQVKLAVPLLEPAAAAGNVVAVRAFGDLLILGKGVAQDKIRGVDLLHQAAAQDFVPALLSLGYSFEFGDGVPADAAKAMEFYTRAADAGLVRAQLILADHFQRGIGTAADDTTAFGWLARAAETADPEANYKLGVAYLEGRGTDVSLESALAAFQVSSDGYYPRGSTALGYMTELGLGGLAPDPEAAQSLYYSGEGARIPAALHNLARLSEFDDPVTARERYERAAKAGELRAAVNLARMMLEGSGGPQDIVGALEWTRRAADGGNAAGLNNLGRMTELGLGVTADAAEARRLYTEAAALGYELAAENLARLGG
jgi:TPR repeat protein